MIVTSDLTNYDMQTWNIIIQMISTGLRTHSKILLRDY